jgi:hypothetical protein
MHGILAHELRAVAHAFLKTKPSHLFGLESQKKGRLKIQPAVGILDHQSARK